MKDCVLGTRIGRNPAKNTIDISTLTFSNSLASNRSTPPTAQPTATAPIVAVAHQ
jgi:hypothetical protein